MYRHLGHFVSRWHWFVAIGWFALLALAIAISPTYESVTKTGEFTFLPPQEQSPRAERLFREAFPSSTPSAEGADDDQDAEIDGQQNPLGSSVVLVLRREETKDGLTEADREFILKHLKPTMLKVKETHPNIIFPRDVPLPEAKPVPVKDQIIRSVTAFDDSKIGVLLDSPDKKSSLLVIDLKTEFMDRTNVFLIRRIRAELQGLYDAKAVPLGLEIALSGSASVGHDMIMAEADSAKRTEFITKFLCIALLLIIYRAPILALIPLVTVGLTVPLAVHVLLILAKYNLAGMFTGLETYIVIVVYGAGIDYCLFLIARFKEELDKGYTYPEAITTAVEKVGAALATSAAMSMFGIGMMSFAEFGKFREAGFAIAFGLFVGLCTCLTLTPALMRIFGRWTFWPDIRKEKISVAGSWVPQSSVGELISKQKWLDRFWQAISDVLARRPGRVFLGSVAVMLPFAILGVLKHAELSYGLLSDLPQDYASVEGARAIQLHFPAGTAGTTTILVKDDDLGLKTKEGESDLKGMKAGREIAAHITDYLMKHADTLKIADVRSQSSPLGVENSQELRGVAARTAQLQAYRAYTSRTGPYAGQVLRMDIIYRQDPFSRDSFQLLSATEEAVRAALREGDFAEKHSNAEVYSLGATSSVRDVKRVTDRDQIRIDILVTSVVFILIVILLRQPAICAYLILTVIFSYLVSLGMTYVVFSIKHGPGFPGIDWKIPIYLFTLLLALGGDYNILLMARVQEEQEKHGYIEGVLIALRKTGGIISSCGVIMAGTFLSLMTGSLEGMVQMGFALTVGVLLDTFLTRPVLVPSYLILLYKGAFGPLTRVLGGPADLRKFPDSPPEEPTEPQPIV